MASEAKLKIMNTAIPMKQKKLIEKCLEGAISAPDVTSTIEWIRALQMAHDGSTWKAIDRLNDPLSE